MSEIEGVGYLSPEAVFVDGTHIKANVNIKKVVKKAVPTTSKIYEEQLMAEINEGRENHGKSLFDNNKPPEEKIVNVSVTDPGSYVFHKGEHKKYLTQGTSAREIPKAKSLLQIILGGNILTRRRITGIPSGLGSYTTHKWEWKSDGFLFLFLRIFPVLLEKNCFV
ncbi:MAG: hypothetical protein NC084_10870 [Bacteroides sp.]|nr:hypothetical protein [Eubacterium sp.]MCM1419359.1 hypothetical protein [Roseburia sp.]MCM1463197.1 hypothetical protein [Bacteroides sp.]